MKTITLAILCFLHINLFAQPVINSFTPMSGPIGTTVTITGSGFGSLPSDNTVFFGAVRATVTIASANSLTVSVPTGATFEPVVIINAGLSGYSKIPFSVTYPGTSPIAQSSFVRTEISQSLQPGFVLLKDLDGDGIPDMVNCNTVIKIEKNISTAGNLSFEYPIDIAVPTYVHYMVIDDLNGDGKPDIIGASYGVNKYYIMRNASTPGTITMDAVQEFSSTATYGIAVSDIDGDGKPDMATTNNESAGRLIIHRNSSSAGAISFVPAVTYVTGNFPRSLSFAHINADNKPDLVVANQYSNSISVFINTSTPGNFSFAAKIDLSTPAGSYPESIAAGDYDGDGLVDIAVGCNNNATMGTVTVFRNTTIGATSFAAPVQLTTGMGWNPYLVKTYDIDGDGKLEIAATNRNNSSTSIFKNNSAPGILSFDPKVDLVHPTSNPSSLVLFFGDADGDNKPDIIAGSYHLPTALLIYRNTMQVLPVKFLSFSATGVNGNAVLNWQVNNETSEVDRYEVQVSSNGSGFNTISTIPKKANNLTSNSYIFTDQDVPVSDVIYYRIKQVDTDGGFVYSSTRSIKNAEDFSLRIFPNPVKETVSVNITMEAAGDIRVLVMDAAGNEIKRFTYRGRKGENTQFVNLTDIAAGTYLFKVQAGELSKTLKLIKE